MAHLWLIWMPSVAGLSDFTPRPPSLHYFTWVVGPDHMTYTQRDLATFHNAPPPQPLSLNRVIYPDQSEYATFELQTVSKICSPFILLLVLEKPLLEDEQPTII